MSTATIAAPPSVPDRVRRWTVADFDRMIAAGIVVEGSRAYLWGGEILEPMSENEPHANVLDALLQCLQDRLDRGEWTIRPNHPMGLREGYLPSPDIVVLPGTRSAYRGRRPTAADAALVIEVSDTSYSPKDSVAMLQEYARAGVVQYWIVNINARRVEVYRDPHLIGDVGAYAAPTLYPMGTEVPLSLAAAPGQPDRAYPPIPVLEILRDSLEEAK